MVDEDSGGLTGFQAVKSRQAQFNTHTTRGLIQGGCTEWNFLTGSPYIAVPSDTMGRLYALARGILPVILPGAVNREDFRN